MSDASHRDGGVGLRLIAGGAGDEPPDAGCRSPEDLERRALWCTAWADVLYEHAEECRRAAAEERANALHVVRDSTRAVHPAQVALFHDPAAPASRPAGKSRPAPRRVEPETRFDQVPLFPLRDLEPDSYVEAVDEPVFGGSGQGSAFGLRNGLEVADELTAADHRRHERSIEEAIDTVGRRRGGLISRERRFLRGVARRPAMLAARASLADLLEQALLELREGASRE